MNKPKVKNTITDKEQIEIKQTSIFEEAPMAPPLTMVSRKKPATSLMKTVARKAPSEKNMKNQEILLQRPKKRGIIELLMFLSLNKKTIEIIKSEVAKCPYILKKYH